MSIKIISIILIILIITALTLFVLGKIKPVVFWIIVGFAALMAYKVIPYLRKKAN